MLHQPQTGWNIFSVSKYLSSVVPFPSIQQVLVCSKAFRQHAPQTLVETLKSRLAFRRHGQNVLCTGLAVVGANYSNADLEKNCQLVSEAMSGNMLLRVLMVACILGAIRM